MKRKHEEGLRSRSMKRKNRPIPINKAKAIFDINYNPVYRKEYSYAKREAKAFAKIIRDKIRENPSIGKWDEKSFVRARIKKTMYDRRRIEPSHSYFSAEDYIEYLRRI